MVAGMIVSAFEPDLVSGADDATPQARGSGPSRESGQRQAELEDANRALEQFTAAVVHDLRAPLRAIEHFAGLLAEHLGEADAETVNSLAHIRKARFRMDEIITDLLHFSRISAVPLMRVAVDLSRMAREVAAELDAAHPGRSIDWVIGPDLMALGDPGLLRLVVENLLGNACKYTRKTRHARIEFGADGRVGGESGFFVRDNGAGFDMRFAGRLFQPFERLHSTAEFEGTGVGLATVRRIVERHGGRIGAQGESGRGATFRFILPAIEKARGAQTCLPGGATRPEEARHVEGCAPSPAAGWFASAGRFLGRRLARHGRAPVMF